MGDRAWAQIRIGGSVTKKDWKRVVEALEQEVDNPRVYSLDKDKLVSAKKIKLFPPNAPFEMEEEEASCDPFEDARRVCRELGLTYVVEQGACVGAWDGGLISWRPDDPDRRNPLWAESPMFCENGEHYQLLTSGDSSDRVANSTVVRKAFRIALAEFLAAERPLLQLHAIDEVVPQMLERALDLAFRVQAVPPLTLVG